LKLHPTVIKELLRLHDIYGGHREEVKLREQLELLEVEVYEQQSSPFSRFLVLEKDVKSSS